MPTLREFFLDQDKPIPGHTRRRPSAEVVSDALRYACAEWGFPVNEAALKIAASLIARANLSLYSSHMSARSEGRVAVAAEGLWRARVIEALEAVGPFFETPAVRVRLDGRTVSIAKRICIDGASQAPVWF